MRSSESQLDTWSHQGSITQSSETYAAVSKSLTDADSGYSGQQPEVFLQGSYANDTNIYAESDVDVVIRLMNTWRSDLSNLDDAQKTAYDEAYSNATYTYARFREDVIRRLESSFGDDVNPGDKAIAIAARGNRRKSDVIAAISYRRYYKFNGLYDQRYDEGICFYNGAGDEIVNYPKQHCTNLTRQHQHTAQWLKPCIRILKNMRRSMVNENLLQPGLAPSYYLEGLMYNVPVNVFGGNYQQTLGRFVSWLSGDADRATMVCANEQYYLVRNDSHTCWTEADYDTFRSRLIEYWDGSREV